MKRFSMFLNFKKPSENKGKSLLIINGAGGVGSIANTDSEILWVEGYYNCFERGYYKVVC